MDAVTLEPFLKLVDGLGVVGVFVLGLYLFRPVIQTFLTEQAATLKKIQESIEKMTALLSAMDARLTAVEQDVDELRAARKRRSASVE